MISSNGTTSYRSRSFAPMDSYSSVSVRNAVVSVPGTATVISGRSSTRIGRRATTIGPYLSPMLHPVGSRAYLSSSKA